MTTQDHPPADHPFGFDTGLDDPPQPRAQGASDRVASVSRSNDAPAPSVRDELWAEIRQQYLRGVTAAECARRYGVGMSTLRERAKVNGWRRKDAVYRPPDRVEPPLGGPPMSVLQRLDPWDEGAQLEEAHGGVIQDIQANELSVVAHCRMTRAVLRGDAMEALRWRKVRDAMDEDHEEQERFNKLDEVREFNSQISYPRAPIAPDWHLDDTDLGDPDDPDRLAFVDMAPAAEPEPAPAPEADLESEPARTDDPDSPDPVFDRPAADADPAPAAPDVLASSGDGLDDPDVSPPTRSTNDPFPDPCSPFPETVAAPDSPDLPDSPDPVFDRLDDAAPDRPCDPPHPTPHTPNPTHAPP